MPLLFQAQQLVQSYLRTTWALLRVIFISFLVSQSQQRWKNSLWTYGKDCFVPTPGQVRAKVCTAQLPEKGHLGEE